MSEASESASSKLFQSPDTPSSHQVGFLFENTYFEIAGDIMLSTAVANGSHVLLTCFYDVCDGFHAKIRLYEHFTPSPYPRPATPTD